MTMGKSKALVAWATGVYYMTIDTDSGMTRIVQSVVWDSSSLNDNIGTKRRVGNAANELILQSTVLSVCRVVGREFTGVGKPHNKPEGEDVNLGMTR